jgi:hypothetical protein
LNRETVKARLQTCSDAALCLLSEQRMNEPVTLICVRERTHSAYGFVIAIKLGKSSMKSLAYVFAAFLALTVIAPSVASAGWHHHHHHHHHR